MNEAVVGIVPCAGYGARLAPFTVDTPKGLIPVGGRPLLEYNLALLHDLKMARAILVIGPHTEEIKTFFGSTYGDLALDYVVQDPPRGLLDAVYQARVGVEDRFMTLLSDEVYAGTRHSAMMDYWQTRPDLAGLVGYITTPSWEDIKKNYSIVMRGARIERMEEKPRAWVNCLLGTGTWALDRAFFDYAAFVLERDPAQKRSFVDALQLMVEDGRTLEGYELAGRYVNVNSPEDLALAEALVMGQTRGARQRDCRQT